MSDTLRIRSALVTGATGFIGGHLVNRLLRHGWDVHVVVRSRASDIERISQGRRVTVHIYDGTVTSLISAVKSAQPDVVFHLASCFLVQHRPEDVERLIASNLLLSTQLAEALAVNGVSNFINTGTSWQHYQDERRLPVNLYAATKDAFASILRYYADARGLNVISLVLFDTYGPADPRNKLVSILWRAALGGDQLLMSPGGQKIDIVFIDDVLDAYERAANILMEARVGMVDYAVSSGAPMVLTDLVREFERATGLPVPIVWGARPYREREVMTPWRDYKVVPGWRPSVSFAEGVLKARPVA